MDASTVTAEQAAELMHQAKLVVAFVTMSADMDGMTAPLGCTIAAVEPPDDSAFGHDGQSVTPPPRRNPRGEFTCDGCGQTDDKCRCEGTNTETIACPRCLTRYAKEIEPYDDCPNCTPGRPRNMQPVETEPHR